MLYREIIAVCSQIHTKHINILCGQNVEFVNVKPGGTYSNHRALKDQYMSIYLLKYHNQQYSSKGRTITRAVKGGGLGVGFRVTSHSW